MNKTRYRRILMQSCLALTSSLTLLQAATTYTFQEGVGGYVGTKDTQIRGTTPDRDDSEIDSLNPDGDTGGVPAHALLRFENIFGTGPGQIAKGSSILRATLTLYFVDAGSSPSLHRMLNPWNETVTWNVYDAVWLDGVTADGVEAAIDPDVTFTVTGVPYFKEIVLPVSTLQTWLDDKAPNYGWVFLPGGTDGVDFDSSEGPVASQRPKLTMVVGTPGEPLVTALRPSPDAIDIAVNSNIEFTIAEGTIPLNPSSVKLSVNGQSVQPAVTNDPAAAETKIVYDPATDFAGNSKITVKLVYSDTAAMPHVTTNEFTFTTRSLGTTLVALDDKQIWRYDRSGADLGTAWTAKNFDDSSWSQGPALIADESGATAEPIRTPISRMTDAGDQITTFYFRTHFNFTGDPSSIVLQLRHVIDDGAVFYLNGVEINRFGFSAGTAVTFDLFASGHENAYAGPFAVSASSLVVGDNVLAVEVHQSDATSSDMVFGAILEALPPDPNNILLFAIDDKTLWRYDRSATDLGTAWKEKNFNDSAWPQGPALIADETGATAELIRTPIDRNNDAGEHVTTFYFRTHFNLAGDPANVQLRLRHVIDDGAVFYLNGTEISRFGISATAAVTFDAFASSHENAYAGPFDVASASLVAGDNVFAVEVHQADAGSSDMVFGAELRAIRTAAPIAPKFTTVSRNGGNLAVEWTGTGTLQSADSVTGPWADVANAKSPFSGPITGTIKFYRLKQ